MTNSSPDGDEQATDYARRVLTEAADALREISLRLDQSFNSAIACILKCSGRVIVTGMGKSGHIGRKIASTLASTGTPAHFMHPAEAVHGDLGMLTESDIALCLSYSGETDELLAILPALKRRAAAIVAITGNATSTLAIAADFVIDSHVERESCPLNLAPTTSTTVMLALGDAIAVALMQVRGFGADEYALLHPAGSLGRRLLLRVSDVMRTGDGIALLPLDSPVSEVMLALPRAHQSAAVVIDADGILAGLITGGDLRRGLARFENNLLGQPVTEIMTRSPLTIAPDALAVEGLRKFQTFYADILEIPVVDTEGRPVGMLMLKDLLRGGLA